MVEEIFSCDVCQAAFQSRNALFRHLREQHSDSKQIAAPPSAEWEAERQQTPVVHAKVASTKKKKQRGEAAPEAEPRLQIETRPESYLEELGEKVARMRALVASFGASPLPEAEVFQSPPEHFRMRVEFDILQTAEGPSYAMHAGRDLVAVDDYPFACGLISGTLMPATLRALRREPLLSRQLFQVNFHATLRGDGLVSLLYRTPYNRVARKQRMLEQGEARQAHLIPEDNTKLTAEWERAAAELSAALGGASVVGRTRGCSRVAGRPWVEEELKVEGLQAPLRYRQLEGFFSQSNAVVCQHMLAWARAVALDATEAVGAAASAPRGDDLLELYCGNGNFCVALAPLFRRVFATEMVKELLDTCKQNAADNGVANITVGRVSAEELALAMDGLRSFVRLQHVDLGAFDFRTVLVDPPRAGLGPQVSAFLARFPRIVYISCNPETLRDDLAVLSRTHDIVRLAAFDQFPYVGHLEMGILLVARGGVLPAAPGGRD